MFRFFPALLGALICLSAQAASSIDLYQAEVVVAGRSTDARNNALGDALAHVLVKNTGDPDAASVAGVRSFINQAASYTQQFSYGTRQSFVSGEEQPETVLTLTARFDPQFVQRIIRDTGLARWGVQRPTTLMWLAVETADGSRVLAGEDFASIAQPARRAAARRGLPILFPILDLQDQRAVRMRELWGGFVAPMAQASQRYGTQTFLLGRIEPRGEDQWIVRWVLYDQGNQDYREAGPGPLHEVIAAGIDFAANELAMRYAFSANEGVTGSGGALVAVHGVKDLADYARLLEYLNELSVVEEVAIVMADGERLDFRLQLRGDLERLDQVISFGRALAPFDPVAENPFNTGVRSRTYKREYKLLP